MSLIVLATDIQAPVSVCFDLARSIDLHKLSTGGTEEQAIAGVTSSLIGIGEEVTWSAKHFGIRQTLTSRITAFDHPFHFRDEMIEGIFKKIIHDHWFEEKSGATLMTDNFEFESPFGMAGKFFNILVLKNYLIKLLTNRNQMIREMAEGNGWKTILKKGVY
jgi:ligand-binding SRPBCC domain-containing protein